MIFRRSALNTLPPSSDLVDEFSHIVRWVEANKLIINSSKTKEIVFRRISLHHYIPPPPLMQIEQVEEVKLLVNTHTVYAIAC